MRKLVLGTAAAFAALVVAGGSARAESSTREKVATESSSKVDFQVIVMRGSRVSRVTGSDGGEISEVTIREDPAPPPPEARSDTWERQTTRIETNRVYFVVVEVERAVPASVLQFAPIRHREFGLRRYDRFRGDRPRRHLRDGLPPVRWKPAVFTAKHARAMQADPAGSWPATPALQRFARGR